MNKLLIVACAMLIGASPLFGAVGQHHIWNRTGETIKIDFVYGQTGACSVTSAILHHTSAYPFGSPEAEPNPDWLQRIEFNLVGANCPLQWVKVTGLTGKIKGQRAEIGAGNSITPTHFIIDRNGSTISISTGDPRNIYEQNPAAIPELTLQRSSDEAEKLTGKKYYYVWNTAEIIRKNIAKELQSTEEWLNQSMPVMYKTERLKTLIHDAKQARDNLQQLYNQFAR